MPYGCLVPEKVDNLLVAGRCVVSPAFEMLRGCAVIPEQDSVFTTLIPAYPARVVVSRLLPQS